MHWRIIWLMPFSRFDARGSSSFQMFGPQKGSSSNAVRRDESQKSKTGSELDSPPTAAGSLIFLSEAASRHAVTMIRIVGSASRTWLTTHALRRLAGANATLAGGGGDYHTWTALCGAPFLLFGDEALQPCKGTASLATEDQFEVEYVPIA